MNGEETKTQRRGGDYWLFVICYSVSKVWGTEGQAVNIAVVLQGQFSGLGKGEAFHLTLLTLDDFPALLNHSIQFIVISVGVVVEDSEPLYSSCQCQVQGINVSGMSPGSCRLVLRRRVHRIMDEEIRVLREPHIFFDTSALSVPVSEFVVREKDELLAHAHIGVTQVDGENLHCIKLKAKGTLTRVIDVRF